MSHLELGMQESAQAAPSAFERWAANAEAILGHDLDGDERRDGYSVDGALAAYRAGVGSAEYAARVNSARRGIGISILTDVVRDTFRAYQ